MDKNIDNYEFFTCETRESFDDEAKKYQLIKAPYVGRIDGLPATVGELTKQEILDDLHKDRDFSDKIFVIITRKPITDNGFQKNGEKYSLFLCFKLSIFIDEVRKHQEKPVFADRIDALPIHYGEVTQDEISNYVLKFSDLRNFTYLMITQLK